MIRPVHRVRVEPDGIDLDVKDGQTIFKAAHDAGLVWPTQCGGSQQCTICTVFVKEGAQNLSKADRDESFRTAALIRRFEVDPTELRMACAARVRGPVVVSARYPIRRATDVDLP